MTLPLTLEEHKTKVDTVHNSTITVLSKKYTNSAVKLTYLCVCGNKWKATPDNIHHGYGCPVCSHKSSKYSHREAKNMLKTLQPTIELIQEYTGMHSDSQFRCKICNTKFTKPFHAMKGSTMQCPTCIVESRHTKLTQQFNQKLESIYGDYWTLVGDFVDMTKQIKIICKQGHTRLIRPSTLLYHDTYLCKHCDPQLKRYGNYSKVSIQWLDMIIKKSRLKIQHAINGQEFRIVFDNNKYVKADGYNARFKIVFEFYGDNFHGNPKVFKPYSKPHPFIPSYTKSLHNRTLRREEKIKDHGYHVISCWESDFLSDPEKCVDKAIARINAIKKKVKLQSQSQ